MSLRCGRWIYHRRTSSLRCCASLLCLIFALGLSLFFIYLMVFTLELVPWNPTVERWCDHEDIQPTVHRSDPDEITVVTMFLNLGFFKKGERPLAYHSPYKYKRWMRTFGKMVNRVIAYMEDDNDVEYFRNIRSCLPANFTKIIKINRSELQSFQHFSDIDRIYSNPSYPKYSPNTVYPEYACAMHAKYDVLEMACVMNYFSTPYLAWVDIGLFRNLDETSYPPFKLVLPKKFNPEKIGFSQVWPFVSVHTPDYIMKNKMIWVSGSMILATRERMLNFVRDYKEAVNELLDEGLSNTDQEVIYSMYTENMRKPHYVKIKSYTCREGQYGLHGPDARYFCLGYMCRNEGNNIHMLKNLRSW